MLNRHREITSKWYKNEKVGGLSRCIAMDRFGSVLPNCVGYALGRFHEVLANNNLITDFKYRALDTAPSLMLEKCNQYYPELTVSDIPREDSILVLRYPGDRFGGHVAYVEAVNNDLIFIGESSYKKATFNEFWIPLAALKAKGDLKFIYSPIAN